MESTNNKRTEIFPLFKKRREEAKRVEDLKVESGSSLKQESHACKTLFKNGGFVVIHNFCFFEGFRSERMEGRKEGREWGSGGPFF